MDEPFGDLLRRQTQKTNLAAIEKKIDDIASRLVETFTKIAKDGRSYGNDNLLEKGQWMDQLLLTEDMVRSSEAWQNLQKRARELNLSVKLYASSGYELLVTYHLDENADGEKAVAKDPHKRQAFY